jgi:hypothetical protein
MFRLLLELIQEFVTIQPYCQENNRYVFSFYDLIAKKPPDRMSL